MSSDYYRTIAKLINQTVPLGLSRENLAWTFFGTDAAWQMCDGRFELWVRTREMPEKNACVFWCPIADVTAVKVYRWRSERPATGIWSLYGRFMERTVGQTGVRIQTRHGDIVLRYKTTPIETKVKMRPLLDAVTPPQS
jgi:hypothetical protein